MGESTRRLEEKKKKFEANPDDFVCLEDVVVLVDFNTEKQMNLFVNGEHLNHVAQALGVLIMQVPRAELYFKAQMKNKEKGIIVPGGGNGRRF